MSKVPAADATLRILSYLAAQPRPTAASHIGRALEIPRSSLYDILQALIARGYVIHHAEDRAYGLGPSAHELSSGYNRHAPMARLGRRVVEGLVDKVGESGHLSILRGHEIVYLVEARAQNRTASSPMLASASMRCAPQAGEQSSLTYRASRSTPSTAWVLSARAQRLRSGRRESSGTAGKTAKSPLNSVQLQSRCLTPRTGLSPPWR